MNVQDIAAAIAAKTRADRTPDWDPTGLQVGDPRITVERVGVCHEVTESVVTALEADPVDLLVTYHPLLFMPTNRIVNRRSAGARAFRLISTGVAVVVTHTDFDTMPGGTADELAALFDMNGVDPFGGDLDEELLPIGRVGAFKGTVGTVDAMLSNEFGHVGLRVTGDREKKVSRLAVVPGSGSGYIEEAAAVADALVTGDVSHHRAVAAADLGLAVLDPGHIATERPGMSALARMVNEVSGLDAVDLTGHDPQTWS